MADNNRIAKVSLIVVLLVATAVGIARYLNKEVVHLDTKAPTEEGIRTEIHPGVSLIYPQDRCSAIYDVAIPKEDFLFKKILSCTNTDGKTALALTMVASPLRIPYESFEDQVALTIDFASGIGSADSFGQKDLKVGPLDAKEILFRERGANTALYVFVTVDSSFGTHKGISEEILSTIPSFDIREFNIDGEKRYQNPSVQTLDLARKIISTLRVAGIEY